MDTHEDNLTFDEAVSHPIPLKLIFVCIVPFSLILCIWLPR
jgi:hypothetical protein